ncbi:MAG: stage IV sporulation protein A [Negativibacillus sp.]
MEANIYQNIVERTDGDIYIGVVGPVRTGKSSFIKRFMETIVIPHMDNDFRRDRAIDELPQSAAGKTIMTTEPKFIPEDAVKVEMDGGVQMNVRMIDCVGYIVPSSLGYVENEQPRMVRTPWFEDAIPFNMAAEIGTQKVINEHSTIGLVITTDGSISDIPREEYEEAEERVIEELKQIDKPFTVLLNCAEPDSRASQELAERLQEKYGVPVMAVNCLDLSESSIREILSQVLKEFPIKEICVDLPRWIVALEKNHWLKQAIFQCLMEVCRPIRRLSHVKEQLKRLEDCPQIRHVDVDGIDLGRGSVKAVVQVEPMLFYQVLGETTGLQIESEEQLMPCMAELAHIRREYEKIKGAMEEVQATGYGIVMPALEELRLEEPEIVKQGGRYGVRLRASAPSIHMMRADITTEVSPIVGSEKQSEELVKYLLNEFEEDPVKIWDSNIFGKSLHELVNEGMHNKLYRMPSDARMRLQETIERIINDGCNGLICIIL